ncbi:MAG: hypothetical protein IT366_09405 [Candidatus Hydrogenedentes bacterium]|nr:hypothetical protein [Candidatus Hydrogenedentota bacterium]
MGDVNVQLVREFFELNLFHVLTNWQQAARRLRPGEHGGQLFVQNTATDTSRELPFLLHPTDIAAIERAVVEIRAWHADRFYPSVIDANPVLYEFVSEDSLALASEIFAHQKFSTVLIVSELPASPELRQRSLDRLRNTGIEHVIEFPLILRDIINRLDANGTYPASETLQTLRLLKRYKLVRNQQMEFAFTNEAPPSERQPVVEASPSTSDE